MSTIQEKTVRQTEHYYRAFKGNPAENYQKYFVPVIGKPIAQELIKAASIKEGENVIDIACGTGAAAFLAKEKTGRDGMVAGIDINPGMIAVARSITPGNIKIDWQESPAEHLPFENNTFDVAVCSISFQFFTDKPAALREIHRILKPGGRLAVIVPGPNPVFEEADDTFSKYLGEQAAGFIRTVFSLKDHNEINKMITDAGFKDVNVTSERKDLHLPLPENFLWQYLASTPLISFAEKMDKETYDEMEDQIREKWQPHVNNGDLILEHDTILATAVKN